MRNQSELLDGRAARAERHLRVAIRNATIMLVAAFGIGVSAGWFLRGWRTSPVAAIVGVLVGLGFIAWYCRMFYVTKGLLHRTGFERTPHSEEIV